MAAVRIAVGIIAKQRTPDRDRKHPDKSLLLTAPICCRAAMIPPMKRSCSNERDSRKLLYPLSYSTLANATLSYCSRSYCSRSYCLLLIAHYILIHYFIAHYILIHYFIAHYYCSLSFVHCLIVHYLLFTVLMFTIETCTRKSNF
jgi:hypothetical protein